MLLVIDIESFIYRACTASKVIKQLDKYVFQEVYDITKGFDYIENNFNNWRQRFLTNDIELVVGDKNNWRKDYDKKYKANRKDVEKPIVYYPILKELQNKYPLTSLPNLEADDTCRIINEDNQNYATRKVLISIDKDFKTFPCELFNPLHNTHEVINQTQADYNLMFRILVGDTSDNYKGLDKFGEKTATDWLDDEPRTWIDLRELFREKGQLQDFERLRNLASMVSIDRYDFNTGKVKLLKEIV